jgi:hypothetical protein
MPIRIVRMMVLCAALAGCAHHYALSESAQTYRASLDDTQALDVVGQNVARNSRQAGLCGSNTNRPANPAERAAVEGSDLVFDSYYEVMTGVHSSSNVAMGNVTTSIGTDRAKGRFRIDLRNISKIRVLDESLDGFGCMDRPLRGVLVQLTVPGVGDPAAERPNDAFVNISDQNLDHFLAALTRLSPDARLLQGAGF